MNGSERNSAEVEIFVNEQAVKIVGRQTTGRHIKMSAVEQGVDIQLDSVLGEETEHGPRVVADDEHLEVLVKQRFTAHPTDVRILVNGQHVTIAGHRPSGRHIKASAIEQGVQIQLDFSLYLETDDGQRIVADDEHLPLRHDERFASRPSVVEISVNDRRVTMSGHQASGLEIKRAAIAQGVPIHEDFVLSEELGERRSRVVGDDEIIHLRTHMHFIAVAPDDNSFVGFSK